MGPERGGGVGGRGLVSMEGVGGGDTRVVVDEAGLIEEGEVDPFVFGNRSG